MKHPRNASSVTSVPRAPQDEDRARVRTYAITMGIRILCFVLMVLVTPYGWYTWVFAAGAILLPYFAVVVANAGQDSSAPAAESPKRAIEAIPAPEEPAATQVIRLQETHDDPENRP